MTGNTSLDDLGPLPKAPNDPFKSTFMVRCPKCNHHENVKDVGTKISKEGCHLISCSECDLRYAVDTCLVTTYTSPPYFEGVG